MNFTETLDAHHITYKPGAGRGEIRLCCPFCVDRNESADTRYRLGVNYITNLASCFNCGFSSRKAPQLILNRLRLKATYEADKETEPVSEEDETVITLPEGFEYIKPDAENRSWYLAKAIKYLREDRQVPNWQIKAKKVGVTIVGTYAYRIVFPVAFDGELVGLVGRDFTNKSSIKYLNSTGVKYLYNCPISRSIESLVLSEGIFKCLKIERVAKVASSALLGHTLTPKHIEQLKSYPELKEIIVWPDPDKIGIRSTADICTQLCGLGYKVKVIYPIPKVQADELTDKVVKRLLDSAVPFGESVAQKFRTAAAFM